VKAFNISTVRSRCCTRF